jgi:hypothetical protein
MVWPGSNFQKPLVQVIEPPYKVPVAPSEPGQLLFGAGTFGG